MTGRVAVLVACLAACSSSAVDRDADRAAIDRARRQLDEGNRAGDPTRIAALYAPDAVMMPTGIEPLVGRAEIVESFEATYQRFGIASAIESDELAFVARDWAFDRGHYRLTMTPKASGAARDEAGSYFIVWQRQPDGSWQIARDIDNSWTAE